VLIVFTAAVVAAFYVIKKRAGGSPDHFNDMPVGEYCPQ
jgi:hypothetical protein